LHYVLFNFYGEFGWAPGIEPANGLGRNISIKQFYAYLLMIRPGQDFVLHYGGKLFQQWCVDQYAKVEFNRLNYFRMNQKKKFV
jgi:hypothetical protein